MSFVSESEIEAVFATGPLKWTRAINEKDRVIYVVFVVQLCKKLIGDHVVSCRFKLCV